MTDEAYFNAALDAAPEDSTARLLLAEWLGERGDERAAGYRWLAERGKWRGDIGDSSWWSWVNLHDEDPTVASHLIAGVFNALRGAAGSDIQSSAEYFPSRREAEESLCRAVMSAGG